MRIIAPKKISCWETPPQPPGEACRRMVSIMFTLSGAKVKPFGELIITGKTKARRWAGLVFLSNYMLPFDGAVRTRFGFRSDHCLESKNRLFGIRVRRYCHRLVLDIRAAVRIKLRSYEACTAYRYRCFRPVRSRTSAGPLGILNDKRCIAGVLKLVGILHYLSFGDSTEVVIDRCELELGKRTFRLLLGYGLNRGSDRRAHRFFALKFSEPAFKLGNLLFRVPVLAGREYSCQGANHKNSCPHRFHINHNF